MRINYWYLGAFTALIIAAAALLFPTSYEQGLLLKRSYRYDEAIAFLKATLAKKPESRSTMVNLADLYSLVGDSENARAVLLQLHRRYPENDEYLIRLARMCEWQGDLPAAMDLYRELRERDPDNREYFDKLSALYSYFRRDDDRTRLLERGTMDFPADPALPQELERQYAAAGQAAALEQLYYRRIRENPADTSLYLQAGHLLAGLGRTGSLEGLMNGLLDRSEAGLPQYLAVKNFFLAQGMPDAVLAVLRRTVLRFPGYRAGRLELAERLTAAGKLDEAIAEYRQYLGQFPDDTQTRARLAEIMAWAGYRNREIEELNEIAARDTLNAGLLEAIALRHEWNGDPAGAVPVYEELYRVRPDRQTADRLLELYRLLGKDAELERFLITLTATADSAGIPYLVQLAGLYEARNDLERAVAVYLRMAEAGPGSAGWYLLAAERSGWLGNTEQSLDLYAQSVERGITDADVLQRVGEGRFWQGRHADAVRYLERAFSLAPEKKPLTFYLGEAYANLGDAQRAGTYYRRAYGYLRNRRRNATEQQMFFIAATRLGLVDEVAGELYRTNLSLPFYNGFFTSVVELLFDRREYVLAGDLLSYYRGKRYALPPELRTRIREEAASLASSGRWDIAGHLEGYLEP